MDLHDRHAAGVPVYEDAGGVYLVQVHAEALKELGGEGDLLEDEARRGRLQRAAVCAAGHREDVAALHRLRDDAEMRLRRDESPRPHEVWMAEAAARASSGISAEPHSHQQPKHHCMAFPEQKPSKCSCRACTVEDRSRCGRWRGVTIVGRVAKDLSRVPCDANVPNECMPCMHTPATGGCH